MMNYTKFILSTLSFFVMYGCIKEEIIFTQEDYACELTLQNTHPDSISFEHYLSEKTSEGIPGISMLIANNEGVWSGAAGFADISNNINMQSCSVNRIGSITKTFTAVSILQLAEEGLLGLEDNISNYLDTAIILNIHNASTATIKQLLNHTSGIPDFTDNIDYWLDTYNDYDKLWTAEQELEYAYGLEPEFNFESGTQLQYSNTNFVMLGLIVEMVSGVSGERYYQNHIFNTLGMTQTYFNQTDKDIPSLVKGYHDEFGDGVIRDYTNNPFAVNSMAGGIASNTEDLFTFVKAIMTPGILLNQNSIDLMLESSTVPLADPSEFDYGTDNRVKSIAGLGLGVFKLNTDYGIAIGHNGGFNGRRARMWFFPESETSIIFMYNGTRFKEIGRKMFRNEILELVFN